MSFLAKTDLMLGSLKRSLGEKMVYTYRDGGSSQITAVWNREHEIVDANTETVISTTHPNIGVQLKDLIEPPKENDTVDFLGNRYRVIDIEEDGQGAAQLILHKI